MFGLAALVWAALGILSPQSSVTIAITPPAEGRRSQTATIAAQHTRFARQTRRARTETPETNLVIGTELPASSPSIAATEGLAVETPMPPPTWTPPSSPPPLVIPTAEFVPTPAADVAPTPLPTLTSLPPLPSYTRAGLWSENLAFGNAAPFASGFKNRYLWLDWSYDGTQLAFNLATSEFILNEEGIPVSEITFIAIADEAGQSITSLAKGFYPKWSPDGKLIAYQTYEPGEKLGYVRIINVETREETQVAAITKGEEFTSSSLDIRP